MHATLCRLLSRAPYTLYYQKYARDLPDLVGVDLGDRTVRDWLIEEGLKAYTLDKMHPLVQGFLKDCDRCLQLEDELAEQNPNLSYEERKQQAVLMFLAEQEQEQEVVG